MRVEARVKLEQFYRKVQPDKMHNLNEIYLRFEHREMELERKLIQKYGIGPGFSTIAKSTPAEMILKYEYNPNYKCQYGARDTKSNIDYCSRNFNPELALQQEQAVMKLLLDRLGDFVLPLDNMSKCRTLLPKNHPEYVDAEKVAKSKMQDTKVVKKKANETKISILNTIAHAVKSSPMDFIKHAMVNKSKVCVVIRRVNSIRGVLTGIVKAMDKHMNLCLLQVKEYVYHRNAIGPISGIIPSRLSKSFHVESYHVCYSKQLLVRGDNIVMVYLAPV